MEQQLLIGDERIAETVPVPFRGNSKLVNILFVIDQLCETGGAERCLLNTIRLLPKDRFRPSLATFKIDRSGLFNELPCPLHLFPLRRTYDWNGLRTAWKIRQLIKQQDIDIVQTFFETSDLWTGPIAKLSGTALISSRRDMGILRHPKHQLAYRAVAPLFDTVLTVSEQVRNFCIQQDRLDPRKVTTIYNGIELSRIEAARPDEKLKAALGLFDASHLIVTVGHIRKVKNIDGFLETAFRVCKEFPRAAFLIVGDVTEPEYFRQLQILTSSLGLDKNVRFMGASENVLAILKLCDVFCLLSHSEGFSNALVEAMACSLPCVATRVGGNAEAMDNGVSGLLVDVKDSEAAAEKILWLLRYPDLARRMGQAGRRIVELNFSAEAMVQRLVGIYESVLARTHA